MYERSYGYRYAELGDHPTVTEIAAVVRKDIKQAVEEGLLPSRWKYSVRSESYSGGQSISVDVLDCADAYVTCDGGTGCRNVWCSARNDPIYAHAAQPHQVLTADGEAAMMTLKRIHGAYNHDGSEAMVDYHDVRYYGGVDFEDASSAAFRAKEKQRLADRKAAREEGTVVGKVANWKRDGSKVVHLLVEADGKKVLGCGARASSRGMFRATDESTITCSRCAARAAA